MTRSPSSNGFALFPTSIGTCAIAWTESGIARVHLPDLSEERLRERFARRVRWEEALPPRAVGEIIAGIRRLLLGDPMDLRSARLDERGLTDFQRRVYQVTRGVPPGETLSYGAVAARVGEPEAAQAVGRALGANPFPIIVPCHRVIGSDGALVGFSAPRGLELKRVLLEIESAQGSLFAPGLNPSK